MGERRLVVHLTPLGRRVGLLAASLAPLAWVLAALGEVAGLSTVSSAGALLFLCLCALAALAQARWRARAGFAGLELCAPEAVCGDEGESVLLPLELRRQGGKGVLRDLELLAGHARIGVARPLGFLETLEEGESARVAGAWRLARRGRWRQLRLSVASCWPLGLVESRLELSIEADVLALPRRLASGLLHAHHAGARGERAARRPRAEGAAELRDLRPWREGLDLRLVHWKVSARTGELVLRELEGEERGALRLFLVLRTSEGSRENFEEAVRVAATLARDALAQHPVVRTSLLGSSRREAPFVRRSEELFDLYACLAEVEAVDECAIDLRALAAESLALGELPVFVHAASGMPLPRMAGVRVIDCEGSIAEARPVAEVGA